MQTLTQRRSVPVDAAKTAAIFGTLLIHASAAGGFAGAPGSFGWTSALFWNCLLRSAVPVFFLCSGALLLPPEKEVTVRRVWTKYIPRILAALLFWAAAYEGVELLRGWCAAGVLERTALRQAALNLVLFHHKNHLYYLHIILLVYAVLPLTRRLVAAADRRLLNYALGIWFVLGCLAPTLKFFPPLSLVGGIPAQYPINLTWCAVGYGVLGDVLTQEAPRHRPRTFVWLYLAGTALTFGLTLAASVKTGALYQVFLQGSAPGVCLQAAGLYGFCAARWQNRDRWPMAETVSKAHRDVILREDVADLVKVRVEEVFRVMRDAPAGHDRAAAGNDAGEAVHRQRNMAEAETRVDREVVNALLRLLDQRIAVNLPGEL